MFGFEQCPLTTWCFNSPLTKGLRSHCLQGHNGDAVHHKCTEHTWLFLLLTSKTAKVPSSSIQGCSLPHDPDSLIPKPLPADKNCPETSLGYIIWVGLWGHAFPRKTASVFVSPSMGEVFQLFHLRCIIPMAEGWVACWATAGVNQISWWTPNHLKPLPNHYAKCLAGGSFFLIYFRRE